MEKEGEGVSTSKKEDEDGGESAHNQLICIDSPFVFFAILIFKRNMRNTVLNKSNVGIRDTVYSNLP